MADEVTSTPESEEAKSASQRELAAPAWVEEVPSRDAHARKAPGPERRPGARGRRPAGPVKPDRNPSRSGEARTGTTEPEGAEAEASSGEPDRRRSDTEPKAAAPPAARRRWPWIASACCLLLAAGGFYLYRAYSKPPANASAQSGGPPRVPVEAVEAKATDLPIYLFGLGTVQAFNNVVVRSRVDGQIDTVAFTEGQTVKPGDLLAQIDPRPYQASLDQAAASRTQNEARLLSARLDLERTQQLASRGFAPQQTLDQQTANVRTIEGQLASDRASIEAAQTQLGYTTIRSPIEGRTGLRLVDKGNIVRSSDQTGIVEIAQLQPISVVFTAPEGELRSIAAALKDGKVEVAAYGTGTDRKEMLDTGQLALVNNEVDSASGTVRLKATFANGEDRLWPGLSVVTRLLLRTLRGVVTVPDNAVQRGQNELFVYVVGEAGKAEKRTVKVGPFSEGMAQILDGLRPGERVVTAGQSRLTEGVAVDTGQGPEAARQGGGSVTGASEASSQNGQAAGGRFSGGSGSGGSGSGGSGGRTGR